MDLRSLGNAGLMVTPIGLGLAALGRPGYINLGHASDLAHGIRQDAMEQGAHSILDCAWKAGVRYFDAARSYGLAEKFLSTWLSSRNIPPGSVVIGSKWGYTYTADWRVQAEFHEVKDHSLSVLQRQWRESSELLHDHLRLYQIHSATLESGVLEDPELLRELSRLKDKGVHVGLTVSGPQQGDTIRKAMTIKIDGVVLFETVQATWNLLERSVEDALSDARSAGMGVIIKEAVANGRLTERNPDPDFQEKLALLKNEAASLGMSPDALAIAAALSQPFAHIVLSGAAIEDHLASNLEALSTNVPEAVLHRLRSIAETPEQYWNTRKQLPWN